MPDFSFLDRDGFKARTIMPATDVDAIDDAEDGWIDQQLVDGSAWLLSRLDKRYGPFVAPYPIAVLRWLTVLVTVRCYFKRGVNPSDGIFELIKEEAAEAKAEVKEAADGDGGLFELPLRANTTAEGITQGGPFSYSEASPYDWVDRQLEAVDRG
jgi:hypothetical protein